MEFPNLDGMGLMELIALRREVVEINRKYPDKSNVDFITSIDTKLKAVK